MEKVVEKALNWLIEFSGKLFFSILIIVVGFKLIKIIMKKIQKGRGFNKLEKSSQTFISSILNISLKIQKQKSLRKLREKTRQHKMNILRKK